MIADAPAITGVTPQRARCRDEKPVRTANAVSDEGGLFQVDTTRQPSNIASTERVVPISSAGLTRRRINALL